MKTFVIAHQLSHGMSHDEGMMTNHGMDNGWNNIFNKLQNMTEPGTQLLLGKEAYLKLFGQHLNVKYADYIGSETSPPCRHGIRWIVSYCPHGLTVTEEQVNQKTLTLNAIILKSLILYQLSNKHYSNTFD